MKVKNSNRKIYVLKFNKIKISKNSYLQIMKWFNLFEYNIKKIY